MTPKMKITPKNEINLENEDDPTKEKTAIKLIGKWAGSRQTNRKGGEQSGRQVDGQAGWQA